MKEYVRCSQCNEEIQCSKHYHKDKIIGVNVHPGHVCKNKDDGGEKMEQEKTEFIGKKIGETMQKIRNIFSGTDDGIKVEMHRDFHTIPSEYGGFARIPQPGSEIWTISRKGAELFSTDDKQCFLDWISGFLAGLETDQVKTEGKKMSDTHTCSKCGFVMPDHFEFCPKCGPFKRPEEKKPRQTKCAKCGVEIWEPGCGRFVLIAKKNGVALTLANVSPGEETLDSKALIAEAKALAATHWDDHTGELIEKTILAFGSTNRCYIKGPLLSALRYIALSHWEHGAKHMLERIIEIMEGKK